MSTKVDTEFRGDVFTDKSAPYRGKENIPGTSQYGPVTELHRPVKRGQIERVQAILERAQIDVNAQDPKGRTPLHNAVSRDNADMVQLLLGNRKVRRDIRDADGKTPLVLARATEKTDEVVRAITA